MCQRRANHCFFQEAAVIRCKFALRSFVFAMTIGGICFAWFADRSRLINASDNEVKSISSVIEGLRSDLERERQRRDSMMKLRTSTVSAELAKQIDIVTLASGVEDIGVAGFDFDGSVFVAFKNGKRFIRNATRDEFRKSQELLKTRRGEGGR